jgi:nitrite reductase/ring-hydroxylating ferredoxin subunit
MECLRSLTDDGEYIASVVSQIDGPVVLVGHSYGGPVITYACRPPPTIAERGEWPFGAAEHLPRPGGPAQPAPRAGVQEPWLESIQTRRAGVSAEGGAMSQQRVGAAADLPPGKVVGAGRYAVGNAGGRYFAVTRRCRHLGADLAGGSIDQDGCLVCPWHRSAYDVGTGRMVRGPQGVFAKVPGLDFGYRMLTRVLPLGRAPVTERDGELYIGG